MRLKDGWDAGHNDALKSLKACKISIDFLKLFAEPLIDLSRPLPGGKYPGVSEEPDESQTTATSPAMTTLDSTTEISELPNDKNDKVNMDEDNLVVVEDGAVDVIAASVQPQHVRDLFASMQGHYSGDCCSL